MSETPARKPPPTITLAHGAGGKAMRELIEQVLLRRFDNPLLATLDDQARIDLPLSGGPDCRLAFTTDSYVVDPLFFPGGNIGRLAICGTVNDLAVGAATPRYLSCGLIIEEGLALATLEAVLDSMQAAAREAGVAVVTGDTKVVPRGAADKLFINTAGIGVIAGGVNLDARTIRPGDAILVNGYLGDHGTAILDARGELGLQAGIDSDCQPLHGLVQALLDEGVGLRCLRDATRGGAATVLNEFAAAAGVGIRIDETRVPVREAVRGVCELLGLDVLYLANEGKLLAAVAPEHVDRALSVMRSHPYGRDAAHIADAVEDRSGTVTCRTLLGGERVVDLLVGEQLPRIC